MTQKEIDIERLIATVTAYLRKKLTANLRKVHWSEESDEIHLFHLYEEIHEQNAAIRANNPEEAWDECADICAFAAFRADNLSRKHGGV